MYSKSVARSSNRGLLSQLQNAAPQSVQDVDTSTCGLVGGALHRTASCRSGVLKKAQQRAVLLKQGFRSSLRHKQSTKREGITGPLNLLTLTTSILSHACVRLLMLTAPCQSTETHKTPRRSVTSGGNAQGHRRCMEPKQTGPFLCSYSLCKHVNSSALGGLWRMLWASRTSFPSLRVPDPSPRCGFVYAMQAAVLNRDSPLPPPVAWAL